jgi:formylglycine-generating enzyme required for sulfatase activity/serine/threonine protein kinase
LNNPPPADALRPLASADADDERPAVPDHEVLRRIGRGSYGEIWLARAPAAGAWRAIKIVWREDFGSERDFRREFEGMTAFEPISRSHAGFVDILQVGRNEERGFFYYVMELADDRATGCALVDPAAYAPQTLRAALHDRRRLPLDECLALGISLAEALGALHAHGLSHRDIKPDNIIFVGGVPKLADIGLVAAHGQRSFVGTEGYVPPEGPGGVSADLYSLGKVLYEASMGKDRLDFPEVASDFIAASGRRDDKGKDTGLILRGLNSVLLRACDPRPERRYRSAGELGDDLARLRAGRAPRRRRPSGSLLAKLGLVMIALGWGALEFFPNPGIVKPANPNGVRPTPAYVRSVSPAPPRPAPTPPLTGAAEIRSEPAGAEIFDGSRSLGRTPLRVELPSGVRELAARYPPWPETRLRVNVPSPGDGQPPAEAVFRFPPGGLRLDSEPPGASVRLGERELGETPLTIDGLPPGPVMVAFLLPGYRRRTQEIVVAPGETVPLRAELEKNRAPAPGVRWENGLGMRFVPLDGATLMSVWETRLRDFTAFADATGYDGTVGMTTLRQGDTALRGSSWREPGFAQTPEHPVVGVSWKDAYAFCDWLTQREHEAGFLDEGQFYRLPTDAEWSRAVGLPPENGATPQARSGKIKGVYPWGRQWPPPTGAGNYAGAELRAPGADWPAAWRTVPGGFTDGFAHTAPVGSFPPNALGLHDLGGNAWEWCEDRFAPGGETRVLRGGAWGNVDAELLLASIRIEAFPHSRSDLYGFRVVLETPAVGRVKITSEPAGASVFQGAQLLGQTPLTLNRVPAGEAAFVVKLTGHQPAALSGRVAANAPLKLHAALLSANGPGVGQPWENGLGMRFAPLDGTLLFSVWETRVQDYARFCRETSRAAPVVDLGQGPAHPVVNVNRDDAEAFCAWLTAYELAGGRLHPGQRYRLPTDREWSRAVGLPDEPGDTPETRDGRMHGVYPWGKAWPPPEGVGNFADPSGKPSARNRSRRAAPAAGGVGDPYVQTSPVGSFPANERGLFDMAGNVWEWCADAYKNSGALRHWGVLRGGSWADYGPGILQSSYRNVVPPTERDVIYGFRCVIDLQPGGE